MISIKSLSNLYKHILPRTLTFNEVLYCTLPANKIDEFYTIRPDITKTYRQREFEDEDCSPELNSYRPPGFSKGIYKHEISPIGIKIEENDSPMRSGVSSAINSL